MSQRQEQIYEAIRRADAAGDEESVRILAEALKRGDTAEQINAQAAERGLQVDQEALQANIAARDAGRGTNTFVAPERSTAEQVGASSVNALGGLAEGAISGVVDFPLNVARYTGAGIQNALGYAGGGLLDMAGFGGAADYVRDSAYGAAQDQINAPQAADLVEGLLPTSPGGENARFGAQVLGALAIPGGPKTAPRIQAPRATTTPQRIVNEGQRRGVDVMTSDVSPPQNFVTRSVQAIGERIPIAGTGGPRAAQQEQRVQAVRDFAEEYGVTGATDFIDDIARDFTTRRGRQLQVLSGRKNQVIDSVATPYTTSPEATRAIGEQVRRLRGIDAEEYAPVIERLQRFGQALTEGKTLSQIEGQRKLLGELFADPNLARIRGEGEKAINAIYAPLRDDMAAFIQREAGPDAAMRWSSANKKLSEMAGDLSDTAFKRVLQGADVTPERVSTLLFSKKPSETRRLFQSLSASGKNKARSAIVYEALRRSGGVDESGARLAEELSPQKFANAVDGLAKPMGVIFTEADVASANGLARLIQATQRASVAAANPPTGVQNTGLIGAGLLTDWFGGFGSAAMAAGTYGLAARMYESAPIRNMMISLSRTQPGSRQEAMLIERIESVAASQLGLNKDAVARAVNDNPASRLAAEEQPNEP